MCSEREDIDSGTSIESAKKRSDEEILALMQKKVEQFLKLEKEIKSIQQELHEMHDGNGQDVARIRYYPPGSSSPVWLNPYAHRKVMLKQEVKKLGKVEKGYADHVAKIDAALAENQRKWDEDVEKKNPGGSYTKLKARRAELNQQIAQDLIEFQWTVLLSQTAVQPTSSTANESSRVLELAMKTGNSDNVRWCLEAGAVVTESLKKPLYSLRDDKISSLVSKQLCSHQPSPFWPSPTSSSSVTTTTLQKPASR